MKGAIITIGLFILAGIIFILGDNIEDSFHIPLWVKVILWGAIVLIGYFQDGPLKESFDSAVKSALARLKNHSYSVDMQAVLDISRLPSPREVETKTLEAFSRHQIDVQRNDIQSSFNSIIFPVKNPYLSVQVKFNPKGLDENDPDTSTIVVRMLNTQVIDFKNRTSPLVNQWITLTFDVADELGRAFGSTIPPQLSVTVNRVKDRNSQTPSRPPTASEPQEKPGALVRKDKNALQIFSSNKGSVLREMGTDISDLEIL